MEATVKGIGGGGVAGVLPAWLNYDSKRGAVENFEIAYCERARIIAISGVPPENRVRRDAEHHT